MENIIIFANKKYKLLKFMYDNQIKIKEDEHISMAQQEIADILHTAKLKVNLTIKEFKDCGFIENYKGKRDKYIITDKGLKVIKLFENKQEKLKWGKQNCTRVFYKAENQ